MGAPPALTIAHYVAPVYPRVRPGAGGSCPRPACAQIGARTARLREVRAPIRAGEALLKDAHARESALFGVLRAPGRAGKDAIEFLNR